MSIEKIPKSELEVMKVIWNNNSIISSKEITTIMEERMGWKKSTTFTLLSRLANKKIITVEKGKQITYYTAIVSENSYFSEETNVFFKEIHKGSLKCFITTLYESNTISNEDVSELKEWIKNW